MPSSLACVDTDVHATLNARTRDVIAYLPRAWREKFEYLAALPIAGAPTDFNYLLGRYVAGFDTLAGMQFQDEPNTGALLDVVFGGAAEAAQLFAPEAASHVYPARNAPIGAHLASAFNDYILDRYLSDDRLRYALIVSPDDPAAAVTEVRKHGNDHRISSIWLPYSTVRFGDPKFQPLYDTAVEHGLPISGHPFATRVLSTARLAFEGRCNGPLTVWTELSSLLARGTLERNPELHFAFYESGFTWLEPFLARADSAWRTSFAANTEDFNTAPSELVRRQVRLSATLVDDDDPDSVRDAIDRCDVLPDVLIYASNAPRGTGQTSTFDTLPEELKHKILAGNATAATRL
jgi:uncharacterized protein